jgi:hypothetical protein
MKVARMSTNTTLEPPRPLSHRREIFLKPVPYFYYRDCSRRPDPDPLTPLTALGRVPNFPSKMHAILSRPDLADIVAWMPHGRSWRVLKPREFEIRVIPTYFEHAKFSSFIRQANGWGFRRITRGRDRNSYYSELFIRGLPHLCKQMKRPNAYEKQATNPEHEPDFYKISMEHPVPAKPTLGSVLLDRTLQAAPKARMPIHLGSAPPTLMFGNTALMVGQPIPQTNLIQLTTSVPQQQTQSPPSHSGAQARFAAMNQPGFQHRPSWVPVHTTATMNQMSMVGCVSNVATPFQASPPPQFTAGFAAGTTLSQHQFASFLGQTMAPFGQGPR